jgi:hypothetical protein
MAVVLGNLLWGDRIRSPFARTMLAWFTDTASVDFS